MVQALQYLESSGAKATREQIKEVLTAIQVYKSLSLADYDSSACSAQWQKCAWCTKFERRAV